MSRILTLVLAVIVAGCGEIPETYYETAELALSEGGISQGWVPSWLPNSAFEIHEIHDLDTNRSMLAFRFDRSEEVQPAGCKCIEPSKPEKPPFQVEWWPADVPASSFSTYRHRFYSCESGNAYLALSEKTGEAFYWRP